jgi:hypothetical protein
LLTSLKQAIFLPYCTTYLPDFPISLITISTSYATQFLSVPNISFNMLQVSLFGPIGAAFLSKTKIVDRPVYAWTVNEEKRMRWAIDRQLDGICTDDPKKFLEVCEQWKKEEGRKSVKFSVREWLGILQMQLMVLVFGTYMRWKMGMKWVPVGKEYIVDERKTA